MTARFTALPLALGASILLAGCSSASSSTTHTTTPPPKAVTTPETPKPIPGGPYAVLTTNSARTGTTYQVLLVNATGTVLAQTNAKLPLIKPHQTVNLPLASASDDAVYYLDGDTQIMKLTPDGNTSPVKTVGQGSTAQIAFAVNADDSKIAISAITQQNDITKSTGSGWVEDLTDSGGHVSLFQNTDQDSFRWPMGWYGNSIVDAVSNGYGGAYSYDGASATTTASSYHVISSSNGSRTATICENSSSQNAQGTYDNRYPQGAPTTAGVVCDENQSPAQPYEQLYYVDWTGKKHSVASSGNNNNGLAYGACFLSPSATQLACIDNNSQALTLVSASGTPNNLGRRYSTLGWIDSGHLLVDVDAKNLGVLDVSSGTVTNIAMDSADKIEMAGVFPGGL